MDGSDFLQSWSVLLSGVGLFLSGVAAIVRSLNQLRKGEEMDQRKYRRAVGFGSVLVVAGLLISAAWALSGGEQPFNVQLTTAAWEAYNARDFD